MPDRSNAEEKTTLGNQPQRVLVVDDNESVCRLVHGQLEREGYDVTSCYTVQDALEQLKSIYDVVVLDIDLPDGKGFDIVDIVRGASTPTSIVMMTGNPSDENLAQGLNHGVLEILFKPFNSDEIRQAVQRAAEANRRWEYRVAGLGNALDGDGEADDGASDVVSEKLDWSSAEIDEWTESLQKRHDFTGREGQILRLILEGLKNSAIALDLQISENTVKYHVRNLLKKLEMESRREIFQTLLRRKSLS